MSSTTTLLLIVSLAAVLHARPLRASDELPCVRGPIARGDRRAEVGGRRVGAGQRRAEHVQQAKACPPLDRAVSALPPRRLQLSTRFRF